MRFSSEDPSRILIPLADLAAESGAFLIQPATVHGFGALSQLFWTLIKKGKQNVS
jgi:hypothetical protein